MTLLSCILTHFKEYVIGRNIKPRLHPSFENIIDTLTRSNNLDFQLLTVGKLTSIENSIQSCIFNQETGAISKHRVDDELEKKNFLLICKITEQCEKTFGFGNIFLEDCTGVIRCEIPIKSLQKSYKYLGKFVLITAWNLIRLEDCNYIEVTGKLIPVEDEIAESSLNISVVSGSNASILLYNRHKINARVLNVKATVEAVSEIFRVKKELVFVVLMDGGSHIIVKNKKQLYWQKLIIVHEEYVFSNLRLTSLQKGACGGRDIFIPRENSQLYHSKACNCLELSPEEWLKINSDTSFTQLDKIEVENLVSSDAKCFSYQGTVTNVQFLDSGIVELDVKIRLYLCGLPAYPYIPSLREGCCISVSNVHHHPADKGSGVIKLYTCVRSSIKFAQFSSSRNYRTIEHFPITKSLQHSVISLSNVDTMVKLWIHVCVCFPNLSRTQKYVIYTYLIKKLEMENHQYKRRNLLEEFLASNHTCYASKKADVFNLELLSISKLKTNNRNRITDPKINPHVPLTQESKSIPEWSYVTDQCSGENMILVGKLGASINGRMFLVDSSGMINVLISNSTADEHMCDKPCFSENTNKLHCPLAIPSLIDTFISISNFSIIREVFTSNELSNTSFQCGSKLETYLHFCTSNITIVKNFQTQIPDSAKLKYSTEPKAKKVKMQVSDIQQKCFLFCVKYKESLNVETTPTQQSLRFCALGKYTLCDCSHNCANESANIAVPSTSTGKPRSVWQPSKAKNACVRKDQVGATVSFQNENACYFPVLHPRCVYHIHCDDGIFINKHVSTTNTRLQRKLETSCSNNFIQLTNKCSLELVHRNDNRCKELVPETTEYSDVDNILLESYVGCFVNLKGRIHKRIHKEPFPSREQRSNFVRKENSEFTRTSGISTLQDRCIVLNIRDVNSEKEIQVYMNLQDKVYPLGLIPGAVVEFSRLERKVSKFGKVYCQFIVVSSVNILSLFPQARSNLSTGSEMTENIVDQIIPFRHLVDLWCSFNVHKSKFSSVVFLLKVLKLSLKAVCQTCGSQYNNDICCNIACNSVLSAGLSARMSFLVDDGTSVAMVTCTGDRVQTLLQLSGKEWLSLHQEVVKSCREIYWSQNHQESDCDLHSFVGILCDNPTVRKQWEMVFSLRSTNQKDNQNQSSKLFSELEIDDLNTKSIDVSDGQIKTKCLPFLQLECHSVKEVDNQTIAVQTLSSEYFSHSFKEVDNQNSHP